MRALAWGGCLGLLTFVAVFALTLPTHGEGGCAGAAGIGCTSTEYTFLGREVPETWGTSDAVRTSLGAALGVALLSSAVVWVVARIRSGD